MDPESRQHTFLLKLLIVNFLFIGSIWAGKSVFYLFADFALFGFIATLIYVNVVSFIEKKKLVESEVSTTYVSREYIAEGVERLVQILSGLITIVSSTTNKQSIILIALLVAAAGILHFVPTVLVAWIAVLIYVVNEEADHNEQISALKKNILERIDPLLAVTGLKKEQ